MRTLWLSAYPLSFISGIFQAHLGVGRLPEKIKLYENLTYGPHVALGYHVQLQHQKHVERRMTGHYYEKSQFNSLV